MSSRYVDDATWLTCVSYFDGCCAYCGTSARRLTCDHLVPQSLGGPDVPGNIVPACEPCNQSKADREWREWMLEGEHFSQERMNRIFSWRRICRQAGL